MRVKNLLGRKYRRTDLKYLTRAIHPDVKLHLILATAGRCQFRGCNDFLFRHPVTGLSGNFAQYAHIVAFSADGPRGQSRRPHDIHHQGNLMMLCAKCHKLVDDNPVVYRVGILRDHKREHERRVKVLTMATPDNRTVVVKLTAKIRGQDAVIPTTDIEKALFPRFTERDRDCVINLTDLDPDGEGYYAQATKRINDHTAALAKPGLDGLEVEHLSIFALAPIPMLVHLGSRLSTKIRTELYQRHRNGEGWAWPSGEGSSLQFAFSRLQRGLDPRKVALIISLSGKVRRADLPRTIGHEHSIYEISVKGRTPSVTLLSRKDDLEAFKHTYQCCLGARCSNPLTA